MLGHNTGMTLSRRRKLLFVHTAHFHSHSQIRDCAVFIRRGAHKTKRGLHVNSYPKGGG